MADGSGVPTAPGASWDDDRRYRTGGSSVGIATIAPTAPTAADRSSGSADAALVARVLDGDRDAFRDLVDREARTVVRACYRVLGDMHEAEDAAQEAFVTAYRSLATWRADGPFGAWLTRIAVRIAIRMAGRRRAVAWIDPAEPDALVGQIRDEAVDRAAVADDPAHRVIRAEGDARVRAALASLDEPYREVVALRFFGDLSLNEIATATDRPLGTVKTHLHRGLARLRRELETDGPR